MEKIQFKRADSAAGLGTLDAGEIGVIIGRNGRERGIVIGTEYGNQLIRQNPFYSNRVVTGITLDNAGTTPKLTITQHTFDGVESTYDLDFVISGTIDTAKKLSSNAGSDTASKCQPIYFSGGKPTSITQTRGSATTPVWLNGGKIEPIKSYSGECTGRITGTVDTQSIKSKNATLDKINSKPLISTGKTIGVNGTNASEIGIVTGELQYGIYLLTNLYRSWLIYYDGRVGTKYSTLFGRYSTGVVCSYFAIFGDNKIYYYEGSSVDSVRQTQIENIYAFKIG